MEGGRKEGELKRQKQQDKTVNAKVKPREKKTKREKKTVQWKAGRIKQKNTGRRLIERDNVKEGDGLIKREGEMD